MSRRWGRIALVAASVVFSFCLAEGGLRVWFAISPRWKITSFLPPEGWDPDEQLYRDHPFLPYSLREGTHQGLREVAYPFGTVQRDVSINEYGFRGETGISYAKPSGEIRIVCLGGSTVYGVGRDTMTWPAILERELRAARPDARIRVLNLGVSNFTSHMDLVQWVLKGVAFHPDLVLVYSGANDLVILGATDPRSDASDVFHDLRRSEGGLQRRIPFALLRRSAALAVVSRVIDREVLGIEYDLFSSIYLGERAHSTRTDAGIEFFESNLRSISGAARAHGARVLFSTLHVYVDPRDTWPAQGALSIINPTIRRVAQEEGDSIAEPDREIPLDDRSLHLDWAHFSDRGRERLARYFAEIILRKKLLPPPRN